MSWETVIGLEVHVQLDTRSKIFSGASTAFGAEPNTQACAIDVALPGTLPVLNEQALINAVMHLIHSDEDLQPAAASLAPRTLRSSRTDGNGRVSQPARAKGAAGGQSS